jgi:hypothetical protein
MHKESSKGPWADLAVHGGQAVDGVTVATGRRHVGAAGALQADREVLVRAAVLSHNGGARVVAQLVCLHQASPKYLHNNTANK